MQTVSGPFLCRSGCTNEVCDDVSSRLAASEYYNSLYIPCAVSTTVIVIWLNDSYTYMLRSRTVLSFTVYPNMTNPGVAPSFRRNVDKIGTFYINPVRSPQIFGHEGNITALLFRVEDADNPGIVSYHLPLAVRLIIITSF